MVATKMFSRGYVSFALVLFVLALPESTWSASSTIIAGDTIKHVTTLSQIDENMYIINHKKSGGISYKTLYQLTDEANGTIERIHEVKGSSKATDIVTEFKSDLYTTSTGKKGAGINIYRSTDGGDTWDQTAKIGFSSTAIRSEIVKYFNFDGKLFIIVTQATMADDDVKDVVIWNTADGITWNKQVLHDDRGDMTFAGFVKTDGLAYLATNIDGDPEDDTVQLYSTASTTFAQVGEDGLRDGSPLTSVEDLVTVGGRLVLTGYDTAQALLLTSADGIDWSEITHFKYTTPSVAVFQGTAYLVDNKNTNYMHAIYQTSDGLTLTELGSDFIDGIDVNDLTVTFLVNVDESQMHVFSHGTNRYCSVTTDGTHWQTINEDCGSSEWMSPSHGGAVITPNYIYGAVCKQNCNILKLYQYALEG